MYLLSESHVSVHTWPERKCVAIDFYHCGPRSGRNLKIAEELFCDFFGWDKCTSTLMLKRGQQSAYLTNDFLNKAEILKNVRLLHREKTKFQEVRVYDSESMGRILMIDGYVHYASKSNAIDYFSQGLSENVILREKIYDEIMIIGGGDLIIACYVLQNFPNVKKLTLVEIDKRIVEITKQFFDFAQIID